jgi:septal ring factor EnvC (AmiA/AmiB activator)
MNPFFKKKKKIYQERRTLESTCGVLKEQVSELTVKVQEHKDAHDADAKVQLELTREVQVRDTALAKLSAKATGLLTCIKELQRERDAARDEAMELLDYESTQAARSRAGSTRYDNLC